MNIFFLDLASSTPYLACTNETAVISEYQAGERLSDNQLIGSIEEVLQQANWSYSDLTHLACINGPGGFTSLRAATACINTLQSQLALPLASVHLSDLYKARVSDTDDCLWLHSTKKTEVFARGFGRFRSLWPNSVHKTIHNVIETLHQSDGVYTGELIAEHADQLSTHTKIGKANMTNVTTILPKFLSTQLYEQTPLVPWYGREG